MIIMCMKTEFSECASTSATILLHLIIPLS